MRVSFFLVNFLYFLPLKWGNIENILWKYWNLLIVMLLYQLRNFFKILVFNFFGFYLCFGGSVCMCRFFFYFKYIGIFFIIIFLHLRLYIFYIFNKKANIRWILVLFLLLILFCIIRISTINCQGINWIPGKFEYDLCTLPRGVKLDSEIFYGFFILTGRIQLSNDIIHGIIYFSGNESNIFLDSFGVLLNAYNIVCYISAPFYGLNPYEWDGEYNFFRQFEDCHVFLVDDFFIDKYRDWLWDKFFNLNNKGWLKVGAMGLIFWFRVWYCCNF